ncbi:MAG: bifunctional oligoribonuclease/PAP phosphatase NrnA [Clostridia bacterium]|nr:bifunctional oligoribonuclease/PAP phosphatase NrnA [Clostridia bacterium]
MDKILSLLAAYDTIILHRHKNPDGDALGSQIGLKHIIEENYPGKRVYMAGDAAGRYSFMPGSEMDRVPDEAYRSALAVILDCSAPHLVSDERYQTAAALCRLDHHLFCGQMAPVEYVDSSFESCCGLICHLCMEKGLRVNRAAAEALYTGMVTDSGRFRYDSTTARTMNCAAFLLEKGVDTQEIYRQLYAADLAQLQLRARYTLKIQFTPAHVAYIYTTLQEMQESGADEFAISRGMVGVMSDIRGVDIWVNFTEVERGVLCELRSDRYNINPIAVKYGGGGHQKASGATLPDRETAMAMLSDLDALMTGGEAGCSL